MQDSSISIANALEILAPNHRYIHTIPYFTHDLLGCFTTQIKVHIWWDVLQAVNPWKTFEHMGDFSGRVDQDEGQNNWVMDVLLYMCVATLSGWLSCWGWDKMDAISQTTFSSAFSWMKMFEFWLKFDWNLFITFKLTIFHHWLR